MKYVTPDAEPAEPEALPTMDTFNTLTARLHDTAYAEGKWHGEGNADYSHHFLVRTSESLKQLRSAISTLHAAALRGREDTERIDRKSTTRSGLPHDSKEK